MDKEAFKIMWKKWLIDIGRSETEVARELGQLPSGLNQKTRNASMRYTELSDIVEHYGYTIEIRKKD